MFERIALPGRYAGSSSAPQATAALVLALSLPAFAQEGRAPGRPSSEEIIRQLTPPPAPAESPFGAPRSYRGITVERPTPPSIDLQVNFEFGSAQLTSDALSVLEKLGRALIDPTLRASRFMIAGHTDSVGMDEYNMRLSKRRAQAVADYLVSQSGVEADRLVVEGFGRNQLLDPANPTSAVNRRVQVVNLSTTR